MSKIGDYVIWQEENGYIIWDDHKDEYYYPSSVDTNEMFFEYMKENFSKRVQSIMRYAKEEAIRLGHSYVGSEHLLLSMIKKGTGVSIKLFEIYNCDLDEMCLMIEDLIKTSNDTVTLGHLPLTRRAERILRNTYNEATKLNVTVADDEHLLLAILREPEGIAFETLNAFSINYKIIRELLVEKKEFKKK